MASLWEDLKRESSKAVKKTGGILQNVSDSLTGADDKEAAMKAEQNRKNQRIDDNKKFNAFENQDFLNPESDLYVPAYRRSPEFKKKQEEMLSLFNARKDEILSRSATPGISQTRF